ncbi:hypothetical protein Tco_1443615, partial [Tanacetum coccineum]
IMADVNALVEQAPALAPPTRTDEQIYKIVVDIPRHTNFFRAFTASSTIPAIYIQQDALQIMPVNNNKAFSSLPTQDTLINFVNGLGYLKRVKHLSNVVTNAMFQPWRALTTIINLCLTGKTSRMWEEFTQFIHTFTEDKKNLAQHTQGKKKATLIVIPSVRFHPRPESPLYLPTKEPILGYLKFSAKGTKREVFRMPIPNELITDDIREADYYDAYLEKVAKHQRYLAGEEVSDPDSPAPKPAKSTKPKVTVTPPKIRTTQRNGIIGVLLHGTKHKSRKTTLKWTF